ncbi:hypothetical protein FVE67_03495 [Thermosulfurimonas marina]|uniref:Uncharacterized protein n=1 Tax=Thermosulfurimonas marina TaxID=2047767 RepID=A0A6H1WS08_9BACT|nr:hypothetical protein [Thermosulfurimonas marina]QJA05916.1 hypothetical protein FVE67_03495 [Thermosulfurimonas marina]
MKKVLLGWLLLGLFACGGRGVYLYQESANPYGNTDRPWVIIGAKGVGSESLEKRLCKEGELREILKEARLPEKTARKLLEAACGPKASAEGFLTIYYEELAPEARDRLKRAFERHGYTLNDYGC